MARPAPVLRFVPEPSSSGTQIALDEEDATRPKVFECSNFLPQLELRESQVVRIAENTHRYDLTIVYPVSRVP